MKSLILFLIAFGLVVCPMRSAEKKHFVLYAMLLDKTPVDLSDGAKWMMDKGDTFPLLMYKNGGTKVVLQLAGTTFWVDVSRVQVVEEKDVTPDQLTTYRLNVQTYLNNRSRQWKNQAAQNGEAPSKSPIPLR